MYLLKHEIVLCKTKYKMFVLVNMVILFCYYGILQVPSTTFEICSCSISLFGRQSVECPQFSFQPPMVINSLVILGEHLQQLVLVGQYSIIVAVIISHLVPSSCHLVSPVSNGICRPNPAIGVAWGSIRFSPGLLRNPKVFSPIQRVLITVERPFQSHLVHSSDSCRFASVVAAWYSSYPFSPLP